MIIYKTTHLKSRKIYIGQSKYNNPNYFGSGKIIKNIIKKEGTINLRKEILCYCSNKQDMDKKEIMFIKQLQPEYNILDGGGGAFGYTHTEEAKIKIGKASKGNKYRKGLKSSITHKNKISKKSLF